MSASYIYMAYIQQKVKLFIWNVNFHEPEVAHKIS